jgi:hypothetical protein
MGGKAFVQVANLEGDSPHSSATQNLLLLCQDRHDLSHVGSLQPPGSYQALANISHALDRRTIHIRALHQRSGRETCGQDHHGKVGTTVFLGTNTQPQTKFHYHALFSAMMETLHSAVCIANQLPPASSKVLRPRTMAETVLSVLAALHEYTTVGTSQQKVSRSFPCRESKARDRNFHQGPQHGRGMHEPCFTLDRHAQPGFSSCAES